MSLTSLLDKHKTELLKERIESVYDKLLDLLTEECKAGNYSDQECYVAIRLLLVRWIEVIGPKLAAETEEKFQIVPKNTGIASY